MQSVCWRGCPGCRVIKQCQLLCRRCAPPASRCTIRHVLTGSCAAVAALLTLRAQVRMDLVERLADIEYRLAFGTSERLQLGSLVGGFILAKEEIVAAAK